MKQIGNFLFIIFLLSIIAVTGCAVKSVSIMTDNYNENEEKVYYAGVTFLGSDSEISSKYKYSYIALSNDKSFVNNVLEGLKIKPKYFTITTSQSDEVDSKLATLVLAIDRERISVVKVNDYNKVVTQVAAQIMTLDLSTKALISAVPLDVILIDISKDINLSEEYKLTQVRKALDMLLDDFNKKIVDMKVKKAFNKRIKVGDVNIDNMKPTSKKRFESSGEGIDSYKERVANAFNKSISDKTHTPVLPYRVNKSLSVMKLKVADQNYDLSIPDPDYIVNITIDGYRVSENQINKIEKGISFLTYMNIKIGPSDIDKPSEIDKERVFFDYNLVGIANTTVVADVKLEDLDVWTSLFDSKSSLFSSLAENTYNPKSSWIDKVFIDDKKKNIYEGLNKFSQLLDECR